MGKHPIPSKQLRHSNGHSAQIWRATDRSRQLLCVWHLIAECVPVKEACERSGIPFAKYMALVNNNPTYTRRHRQACDARAVQVEDALVNVALGRTADVVEQYDAEGVLVGKQIRTHAPDPKAAHKWLASRKPEQFSEKTETVHSGEIAQRVIMPAVTVGGDAITFDVGSAVDVEVTNG